MTDVPIYGNKAKKKKKGALFIPTCPHTPATHTFNYTDIKWEALWAGIFAGAGVDKRMTVLTCFKVAFSLDGEI